MESAESTKSTKLWNKQLCKSELEQSHNLATRTCGNKRVRHACFMVRFPVRNLAEFSSQRARSSRNTTLIIWYLTRIVSKPRPTVSVGSAKGSQLAEKREKREQSRAEKKKMQINHYARVITPLYSYVRCVFRFANIPTWFYFPTRNLQKSRLVGRERLRKTRKFRLLMGSVPRFNYTARECIPIIQLCLNEGSFFSTVCVCFLGKSVSDLCVDYEITTAAAAGRSNVAVCMQHMCFFFLTTPRTAQLTAKLHVNLRDMCPSSACHMLNETAAVRFTSRTILFLCLLILRNSLRKWLARQSSE